MSYPIPPTGDKKIPIGIMGSGMDEIFENIGNNLFRDLKKGEIYKHVENNVFFNLNTGVACELINVSDHVSKTVWGLVKLSGAPVQNFVVTAQNPDEEILQDITNFQGAYQFNVANFPGGYDDGEIYNFDSWGSISSIFYYGLQSLTLAGGTSTQQVGDINVITVTAFPYYENLVPTPNIITNDSGILISVDVKNDQVWMKKQSVDMYINGDLVIEDGNYLEPGAEIQDIIKGLKVIYDPVTGILPEGTITVIVDAKDNANQQMPTATWQFQIDVTPPFVYDVEPDPNGYLGNINGPVSCKISDNIAGVDPNSIVFNVNGTDYTISDPELEYDGTNLVFTPSTPFNNGDIITITINAMDNVGNVMPPFSWTFTVDADLPMFINLTPPDGSFVNELKPLISAEAYEPTSAMDPDTIFMNVEGVYYTLDDPELTFINKIVTFTPSSDFVEGQVINVVVGGKDITGNDAIPASWSFTIDLDIPIIINLMPPNDTYVASVRPTISADIIDTTSGIDTSSLIMQIDGVSYTWISPEIDFDGTTLTFTPLSDFDDIAIVEVEVYARDEAGNEAVPAEWSFLIDARPPDIVPISPLLNEITNNTCEIIVASITDVSIGVDESSIVITVNGDDYTTSSPEVTFNAGILTFTPTFPYFPDQAVNVSIISADLLGNVSPPVTWQFVIDLTNPHVIFVSPADQDYVFEPPTQIVVTFDKDMTLDNVTINEDIKLYVTDIFTNVKEQVILDTIETKLDSEFPNILYLVPGTPLERYKEYQVFIGQDITSAAGNNLLEDFTSIFTVYQPGDLLNRKKITPLDVLKYILYQDERDLHSEIPEMVDLNGDGEINDEDVQCLLDIVAGLKDKEEIEVLFEDTDISLLEDVEEDGDLEAIIVLDLPTAKPGFETYADIKFKDGINIGSGIFKVRYDKAVLALKGINILASFGFTAYTPLPDNSGEFLFSFANTQGLYFEDDVIIRLVFDVIGSRPRRSLVCIDPESVEIATFGQYIIPDIRLVPGVFLVDDAHLLSYVVTVDRTVVTTDDNLVKTTAQAVDKDGYPVRVYNRKVNWLFAGVGGYLANAFSYTDYEGQARIDFYTSTIVGSVHTIVAQDALIPNIQGESPEITVEAGEAYRIEVFAEKHAILINETLQMHARVFDKLGNLLSGQEVFWSVIGEAGMINSEGLFIGTQVGKVNIKACLKENLDICDDSFVIQVGYSILFLDCNDVPLPRDLRTGYQNITLGKIAAGKQTGIQEVRIINEAQKCNRKILNNILIKNYHGQSSEIQLPLNPITSIEVKVHSYDNYETILSLTSGRVDQELVPLIEIEQPKVVRFKLAYAKVKDVTFNFCSDFPCLNSSSKEIFRRKVSCRMQISTYGDFFIDKNKGLVYVYLSESISDTVYVNYNYEPAMDIDFRNGVISIFEQVLESKTLSEEGDNVIASYIYQTGTVKNIIISIVSDLYSVADKRTCISLDGLEFNDNITIPQLISGEKAKFYIKANTLLDDEPGKQNVQFAVSMEFSFL